MISLKLAGSGVVVIVLFFIVGLMGFTAGFDDKEQKVMSWVFMLAIIAIFVGCIMFIWEFDWSTLSERPSRA